MLIAQVTDIHAAPDNTNLQRFDRVLTWLSHLSPDILVLTGDLTDGGWSEGYAQIANGLTAQSYPSLLLPDNADNRDLMRHVWGKGAWAHDSSEDALHFSYNRRGLHLIGLDTAVSENSYGDTWNGLIKRWL